MKRNIKHLTVILCIVVISVFSMIFYTKGKLCDNYKVSNLDDLALSIPLPVSYQPVTGGIKEVGAKKDDTAQEVSVKLFGIFPVTNLSVIVEKPKTVSLIGTPFGIKLYTFGVLVVKTSAFESNGIKCSPVAESGIKAGDYILTVNNVNVYTNSQMESVVNQSKGNLTIEYSRNNKVRKVNVTPKKSDSDGKYHIGVWLRDSTAGIGTLTFYDRENKMIAGLGHGLCDIDTGKLMSVNNGCILSAKILSVTRAKKGTTGTLNGAFGGVTYSKALKNCNKGIYSSYYGNIKTFGDYEVAYKGEITTGDAQILTTIASNKPKLYNCEVLKITNKQGSTKSFLIKITDKELLKITGGIVQGMSGSPIIKDGKFIGAVTHVLVDDPCVGYAIFAQNMVSEADNSSFKQAS